MFIFQHDLKNLRKTDTPAKTRRDRYSRVQYTRVINPQTAVFNVSQRVLSANFINKYQ